MTNIQNWKDDKYVKLANFLGEDPIDFCKKNIANEDYQKALRLEIPPDDMAVLIGAMIRKDARSIQNFYREIAIGRIVDIYCQEYFTDKALELTAWDKENRLFIPQRPTHEPDFTAIDGSMVENTYTYIDVKKKHGYIHFRRNKLPYLQKLSATKKVYVLMSFLDSQTYTIIEIKPDMPQAEHIDSIYQFGGKPGYRFHFTNEVFLPYKEAV